MSIHPKGINSSFEYYLAPIGSSMRGCATLPYGMKNEDCKNDEHFVHRTNVISNINQNLVICKDIHGLMLISFIQFFKHHIKTVLKNVSKMKIVSDGRGIPQIGWNQVKY